MPSKYRAGFKKDGIFYTCIESNSLYSILDIADVQNYELRERLCDVKIGRIIVKKNRFKILRTETNQLKLSPEVHREVIEQLQRDCIESDIREHYRRKIVSPVKNEVHREKG